MDTLKLEDAETAARLERNDSSCRVIGCTMPGVAACPMCVKVAFFRRLIVTQLRCHMCMCFTL
jgi:hypothetical protein